MILAYDYVLFHGLGLHCQHIKPWLFCPLPWSSHWACSPQHGTVFYLLSLMVKKMCGSCHFAFGQLSDNYIKDINELFRVGQSVRAQVIEVRALISLSVSFGIHFIFIQVNEEANRFTVSLKQSVCFTQEATLLSGYFHEEEMVKLLLVNLEFFSVHISRFVFRLPRPKWKLRVRIFPGQAPSR